MNKRLALVMLLLSVHLIAAKRELSSIDDIAPPTKYAKFDESDSEENSEEDEPFIHKHTIRSFADIYTFIHPFIEENKEVLLVLDWDNTITAQNGLNSPLREGERTKETLKILQDMGVKTMILTARLNGQSIHHPHEHDAEAVQIAINYTVSGAQENALDLQLSAALLGNAYEEFPLEETDCHVVIQDQFVFAGCNKGEAFLAILESARLACAPDIIVFVDDHKPNINSMEKALRDTNYSLVLLHYPEISERGGLKINELID